MIFFFFFFFFFFFKGEKEGLIHEGGLYNINYGSFAIMFILYGMSYAWAGLVHYVTSSKHRYFSGESLIYPRCYGGGCIGIFINHPICS